MKKFLSFLVFMSMIFQASCPVFGANESSDAQKVLELIKPVIEETEHFENFESSVEQNKNGTKVYNFYWSSDGDKFSDLSVTATESGIITGYNSYSYDENHSDTPSVKNKLSFDEAQNLAQKLLDSLNPALGGKLLAKESSTPNLYSNNRYFSVQRYENSVPVSFNTGHLTIDEVKGKIVNFRINYTENTEFDTPQNIISKDTAQEIYKKELGTELRYTDRYINGSKSIVPVYAEKSSNTDRYVNAFSGDISVKNDYARLLGDKEYLSAEDAESGGSALNSKFSEAEIKEIEKLSQILSKEKIVQKLKNIKYIGLSKNADLSFSNLYQNEDGEKIYSLEFKDGDKSLYYSVNAKDGNVLSFEKYEADNDLKKENISKEKAYKLLCEAAKYLGGEHYSEYDEKEFLYPDDAKNSVYSSLTLEREVNGIPYDGNRLYAKINLKDESLCTYYIEYTKKDFPNASDAISQEEAYKALFATVDYNLSYIMCGEKTELVYMFEDNEFYINPFSGVVLDCSFNEKTDKIAEYTDITGHYAEEKIKKLKEFGIGFCQTEFKPDEVIKQKDFMLLLQSALNNKKINETPDYDEIYRYSKRNGYITEEEISPESGVSRISAAKFLIRAMGLESVAKLDGIFANNFSDVKNDTGYTAILSGMKIINGDENGFFNPDSMLSRAEAAIIIYNYLNM